MRTPTETAGLAARVAARAVARTAERLVAPRHPIVERRSDRLGAVPGTLPARREDVSTAVVTAFHYTADAAEEHDGLTAEEARVLADKPGVTWINVDGVEDTETVGAFGEAFGLHPLTIEDVAHPTQRPKLDVYPDRVIVFIRSVRATDAAPEAAYCDAGAAVAGHTIEQIALVLGPGFVLSFQEDVGDVFDAVRDRIRSGAGRIRRLGPDYLLASLLDLVVDHTFITLERMGDATETLEAQALDDPEPRVQAAIVRLRREVSVLRRAVWPLRDVLSGLSRDDTPLVTDETVPYIRDVQDHLVQAVEVLESLREILASLADLYLSALGTRQNEVMKALTVVGSIFLPLTFMTGLYGMNFDNMPELHTRYGYFVLLAVMALVSTGTLSYFRYRDWL